MKTKKECTAIFVCQHCGKTTKMKGFHIGYNLKWLIKDCAEDGQTGRNSQLDKMLKGWLLENLLKDLGELKKLPEIKLKEWVLGYLRYICGNQTRLEYLKTIGSLQINNYQESLKEQQSPLPTREENSISISRENEGGSKMVQDIYESMTEKGIGSTFTELWRKNILEILENNQSTTSTLIKEITEKKTFSCAEINLIIGLFILQQRGYWENWLNQELSDLIKLQEFIKHEGRRNKTELRERYLLRNIRTSLGFIEQSDEQRNFIIGSLGGQPIPEVLPFGEGNEEDDTKIKRIGHMKGFRRYNQTYEASGQVEALDISGGGGHQPCIPVLTPNREDKRQHGRRFKEAG